MCDAVVMVPVERLNSPLSSSSSSTAMCGRETGRAAAAAAAAAAEAGAARVGGSARRCVGERKRGRCDRRAVTKRRRASTTTMAAAAVHAAAEVARAEEKGFTSPPSTSSTEEGSTTARACPASAPGEQASEGRRRVPAADSKPGRGETPPKRAKVEGDAGEIKEEEDTVVRQVLRRDPQPRVGGWRPSALRQHMNSVGNGSPGRPPRIPRTIPEDSVLLCSAVPSN